MSEGVSQATAQETEVTDTDTATLDERGTENGEEPTENGSEHAKTMLDNLCEGFDKLRAPNGVKNDADSDKIIGSTERPIHSCVTVNFIDPTSSGSEIPQPTAGGSGQKFPFMSSLSVKGIGSESHLSLNLYEKLNSIFERDYGSTLHSVPFEHIRSGAPGTIERLPLRLILTRSHAAGKAANGDAMVPWGGTSGTAAAPVSDPAEWHNGLYCHVYIAACESMDHYRSRIRPSLQAFVSQIESASGTGSKGSVHGKAPGSHTGNYSAHYVIVYVPVRRPGGNANANDSATPGTRMGAAIASRMAAARRQIQSTANRELSSDSTHSGGSGDYDRDPNDPAAAPPPGPITHTSKTEKEIYRKFVSDFPNGRTCIMSTLMESVDGTSVATTSPLKNQEWNNYLRMLGAAIVSGFRDRCRRYDEELRRLDAARASSRGTKSGKGSKFDLSHFFLVKESLAFTYEQMQLPAEALLQYEELRAFLPEATGEDNNEDPKKKKRKSSKRKLIDFDTDAVELAESGDAVGFRRRLRSLKEFGPVEETILQYLFARETSLLFQLKDPVEILKRAQAFVEHAYRRKLAKAAVNENEMDVAIKQVEAEKWALAFCWDVKCASDRFFSILDVNQEEDVRDIASHLDDDWIASSPRESNHADSARLDIEKKVVGKLCDLMEFARVRFLNVGDSELPGGNPIRSLWTSPPSDLTSPWGEWEPPEGDTPEKDFPTEISMRVDSSDFDGTDAHTGLLDGALASPTAFEARYIEISTTVIRLNRLSGRKRTASRLAAEQAELFMRREDFKGAVRALLPIVDVCAADRWDRGHFWHLFRLACCQRRTRKVAPYLNTLTLSFGPHLLNVAPKKASVYLQRDFESVVAHPQVAQLRLGISSFLETDLVIESTSGGRSSMLLNFVRKKFVKNFCNVGEMVDITLTIRSNLPEAIVVDEVQLFLVPFGRYEELFHSREPVSADDAMEILSLDSNVSINPGLNTFRFSWTPMTTGICALSTVLIKWKQASFFYDSAAMRKPLRGIEVLPSDPTQSLELNPLFLIPGQVQAVRMTFHSGSDLIQDGTVELTCSEGLQVMSPNEDPGSGDWTDACTFDLPPCKPEGSVVITTTVKSNVLKTIEQKLGLRDITNHNSTVQTMQARVFTSYHHKSYEGVADKERIPAMQTTLEAMVTTLDKPAFTVDECDACPYGEDKVLVTVCLHCNTPIPFSIKEWNIQVPQLLLDKDGDLNQELFQYAIAEGEQLKLSFNFTEDKQGEQVSSDSQPTLHVVLQDEYGKTFNQYLQLNLVEFYEQMSRKDELAGMNGIVADLTCSSLVGLVGGPVTLTYCVDASNVNQMRQKNTAEANPETEAKLLYKVQPVDCDWVVSGKVTGVLDCSSNIIHKLEFIGIPLRPGVLTHFPALSIHYETSEDEAATVDVHSRYPDAFKSLSYVNHMALACPAGTEA